MFTADFIQLLGTGGYSTTWPTAAAVTEVCSFWHAVCSGLDWTDARVVSAGVHLFDIEIEIEFHLLNLNLNLFQSDIEFISIWYWVLNKFEIEF